MATESSSTRKLGISDLYESDFLSDVTLQLNGEDIRVHRAALAPASTWFKDYFEKDPHYDSKAVVDMRKNNPAAVKALVRFCYTGSCDDFLKLNAPQRHWIPFSGDNVDIIFEVRVVARKYGVHALSKHASLARLVAMTNYVNWEAAVFGAIEKVWQHGDRNVRAVATEIFRELATMLPTRLFRASVKKHCSTFVDIFFEMVMIEKDNICPWKWTCSTCKTIFEYAGEQKSTKSTNTMICPWCRT